MHELEISVVAHDGCQVVDVVGELDVHTAQRLTTTLERSRMPGRALVLDLTRVGFMDSYGLRTLLLANAEAGAWSGPLRIVPSPAVDRLIRLAAAQNVLSLYPDRDRALAGPPSHSVPTGF